MELRINHYIKGDRPDVTKPSPEFLTFLGEEGIRKLVARHYNLMRESDVKHLFPADDEEFQHAIDRSADFMIQICGGPDYFNQHRGKPMLINRHAPFAIDQNARLTWLRCYKEALLEANLPEHLLVSFWDYINVFSAWMINTSEKKNVADK